MKTIVMVGRPEKSDWTEISIWFATYPITIAASLYTLKLLVGTSFRGGAIAWEKSIVVYDEEPKSVDAEEINQESPEIHG